MPCAKHSLAEAETVVGYDGECPLCLRARLTAVEEENQKLRAAYTRLVGRLRHAVPQSLRLLTEESLCKGEDDGVG